MEQNERLIRHGRMPDGQIYFGCILESKAS